MTERKRVLNPDLVWVEDILRVQGPLYGLHYLDLSPTDVLLQVVALSVAESMFATNSAAHTEADIDELPDSRLEN